MNIFFIPAKSRLTVVCSECGKARVVYSPVRLTCGEIASVKRREESVMYSCGSPLFDDDHPLFKYCVVREGLNCETPIETQYYAGLPIQIFVRGILLSPHQFATTCQNKLDSEKLKCFVPSISKT